MDRALVDLVWNRAEKRCEYCQMPQAFELLKFQIDHIIAAQHLGEEIESNLALACFACNHYKGPNIAGFDLVRQMVVPLFHPRREHWPDHFVWRGPELTGLTPTGRVTVHVLGMNLDYRVAVRLGQMQEGLFPYPVLDT